jgi:FkbM family methyltransferase
MKFSRVASLLGLASPPTLPMNQNLVEDVKRFLNPRINSARFMVGRNPESELLSQQLPFAGLIDDLAPAGSLWSGLPVVAMHEVPRDAWVLNASTSIAPVSVRRALSNNGFRQVLNLADLLCVPECPPNLVPWFVKDQRADMAAYWEQWLALYEKLGDPESRRVFEDVVLFRLTADPAYMDGYTVRLADQYFEKFLTLSDEVFVDAGGFDGDTTEQFCNRFPAYRKVHFIEPSASNMNAARRRLKAFDRVHFHSVGLSDCTTKLRFNAALGSASSISDKGGEQIVVERLDTLLTDPVGFIKMDLEGWEIHALRGSSETIRRNHPKLAISVYHKASHFREVPALVLDLCPDYKMYFRHYTEGWSESVLYFTL